MPALHESVRLIDDVLGRLARGRASRRQISRRCRPATRPREVDEVAAEAAPLFAAGSRRKAAERLPGKA
jgi:hypothetical protein